MLIGINYPWRNYGWDFGLGPPGWRGSQPTPSWYSEIDDHLRLFQSLGISVVRWFILADGLCYGVDGGAPTVEAGPSHGWRFVPPPLPPQVLEHFRELLQRFSAAAANGRSSIQLLPVLVDFAFCQPGTWPVLAPNPASPATPTPDPRWVKQGRADALTDSVKRRLFLDRVLDPLLQVSRLHADCVYGWELINEPDWVTTGWHPNPSGLLPVPEVAMRAFVEEGKQRVRLAGFKPTVGFASIGTLRRSGITAELNQFHHYPNGEHRLDPHVFDPRFPGIIGEFATAASDRWPELPINNQRVLDRLVLARSLGYPLAMPWSFRAQDRHTAWSPDVEKDIRAFNVER